MNTKTQNSRKRAPTMECFAPPLARKIMKSETQNSANLAAPQTGDVHGSTGRGATALTSAQLRELRSFDRTGDPSDLLDYGQNALAFYARDRVIGALERRGLIVDQPGGFVLTDAGRAALAAATKEPT